MAWEWSHTAEAYSEAYENLQNESREFLIVAFAEWHGACGDNHTTNLDVKAHDRALERAHAIPSDILADYIWQQAESQRTCDNGGFNAWMCPFGCHIVPFSCVKVDSE